MLFNLDQKKREVGTDYETDIPAVVCTDARLIASH